MKTLTVKLIRVSIQRLFRITRILPVVEKLRYYQKCLAYKKSNKKFLKENPGFALPPAYLAFDAYSAPAWEFYKYSGEDTAMFIKKVVEEYLDKKLTVSSVYEWGCGPGRVVRHLPGVFDGSVKICGSDYNKDTIDWCKQNLPGIHFFVNALTPPLDLPGGQFDLVYCISVFTHLSESTGLQWSDELFRVLKPGGILVITSNGENSYNTELLPGEKRKYEEEGIVVRGQYKEGKKMFLTIHNPSYVRQTLLRKFEILKHLPTGFPHIAQEGWIARKLF